MQRVCTGGGAAQARVRQACVLGLALRRVFGRVRAPMRAGLLIVLVFTGAALTSAAGLKERPLSGPRVFGWGFDSPDAVSSDGRHVWVADGAGNMVIELSASTGAVVNVLSGSRYRFDNPDAVSSDGTHVWVANLGSLAPPQPRGGTTVTELSASTGALVKVLSGSRYRFDHPDAVSSDGRHVWVASFGVPRGPRGVGGDRGAPGSASTVTELSASTGAVVKVLSGSR